MLGTHFLPCPFSVYKFPPPGSIFVEKNEKASRPPPTRTPPHLRGTFPPLYPALLEIPTEPPSQKKRLLGLGLHQLHHRRQGFREMPKQPTGIHNIQYTRPVRTMGCTRNIARDPFLRYTPHDALDRSIDRWLPTFSSLISVLLYTTPQAEY